MIGEYDVRNYLTPKARENFNLFVNLFIYVCRSVDFLPSILGMHRWGILVFWKTKKKYILLMRGLVSKVVIFSCLKICGKNGQNDF